MSAAQSNPDAKLNDFFAKKKKKKAAAPATTSPVKSPELAPAAAPALKITSPTSSKGPVIQTKGKTIADLKTVATAEDDDEEEGEGEGASGSGFQWSKKPKKKNLAQPVDKKIAIHSERAFPTLGGAAAAAPIPTKTVKPPSDVRSKNVWANIEDSDEDDK